MFKFNCLDIAILAHCAPRIGLGNAVEGEFGSLASRFRAGQARAASGAGAFGEFPAAPMP
jgi:hypothetical protein